ncbi:DUF11 domain-containing protein, partial [candidate division KSB1 bacterium]|nr:DUF11 domain-containing protein [candidate division KSB1 bacterium]
MKSGVNALLSAATNERPGSPKFQVGEASAESDVDFEAKTFFDFRLDPEKTRYEPIDSVDLRITYRNEGDIKDAITFNINLPAMLRTSDTVFVRAQPPSNAYVSTETTDRIIVVADDSVIADNRDREILIRFKFRITAASATVSSFSIAMVSECSRDSTAEKEFGVDLADLLAVTKSVFPNRVNPGDTINYTITLRRMLERQTLDSVIVVDNLDPGIAEILDVNPPLWSRDGNQTLRWLLLDFTETERQITFKAVIRADYYPAIVSNSRDACQGASLQNFVRGDPQQNEPNPPKQEIPEGVIGNNFSAATTSINPIGDVLRLGSVVITNLNGSSRVLPGDVLRFTVDFANVNTFAPSQFFTVCDTLPDRNYVSAPFDINQARAVYDPVTHVIRLDSLNFAPGEAGSLTFNVRVRDDIQICDDVPLMNKALLKLINGLDCNAANNALDTLLTITDPQT